jgi:8-oxo-dGTP pyrophosphatase MutT (NUDIX family)
VLDFDPDRPVVAPRPAATIVLLREPSSPVGEVEVCVMQRSAQSSFMGGAVVFPGGRVEPTDSASAWDGLVELGAGDWWDDAGIAARIAACREALEEVGIAPGARLPAEVIERVRSLKSEELRGELRARGVVLDLTTLLPLSRWVTPEAEARRFDARFFLARAPEGAEPRSDEREAVRVFWAPPSTLLSDFERGEITLFPPTHRTLELLCGRASVDDALASASEGTLEVVCPRYLVDGGAPILALPGDPAHEIATRRIRGGSRYVLHDGRWLSRDAHQ